MARLTVRNIDTHLVRALKRRAAAHGRSAEAEHRAILREALAATEPDGNFARRAALLRARLGSGIDTAALIRANRDG